MKAYYSIYEACNEKLLNFPTAKQLHRQKKRKITLLNVFFFFLNPLHSMDIRIVIECTFLFKMDMNSAWVVRIVRAYG